MNLKVEIKSENNITKNFRDLKNDFYFYNKRKARNSPERRRLSYCSMQSAATQTTNCITDLPDLANLLPCKFCVQSFSSPDLILHLEHHVQCLLTEFNLNSDFFEKNQIKKDTKVRRISENVTRKSKKREKRKSYEREIKVLTESHFDSSDDEPLVFSNHLDNDDNIEPNTLKCNQCEQIFDRKNYLLRHMKSHKTGKPFMCTQCGKCFALRTNLNSHMLTVHSDDRPFNCETCDRSFKRKDYLEKHIRTHSGEKPHMCPTCGKCFAQKYTLKAHSAVHRRSDERHICTLCGKSFVQKNSIKSHMIRVHLKEKPFSCNVCGLSFSDKSNLNIHNRNHTGEKPYKCVICRNGFISKRELDMHSSEHTGVNPYLCSICGKTFKQKSDLKRHGRTHTGERPYKCPVCFKGFSQKCHLNGHMSLHPGQSRHNSVRCERCRNWFGTADIDDHMRLHVGDSPELHPLSSPLVFT